MIRAERLDVQDVTRLDPDSLAEVLALLHENARANLTDTAR